MKVYLIRFGHWTADEEIVYGPFYSRDEAVALAEKTRFGQVYGYEILEVEE
jgi:hypothetical protein